MAITEADIQRALLAQTATRRQPKTAVKKRKKVECRVPGVPYDLATGRSLKKPNTPKLEAELRASVKRLRGTGAYEDALALSRDIDRAQLWSLPNRALVERCQDALSEWEMRGG